MDWAEQASRRLDEAGYRSGAARRQVIELLANEGCALTALEMDRRLPAGRASIYRTLEQLERLHLVQRIDTGGEAAGYERLDPDEHHHHLVCEECGLLAPFADPALEQAIDAVSGASGFKVKVHDVVLKGTCPSCAGRDA
ncbi:MAG TPA: Fur family transcriptional regulator [Solirubrobacterales bacterium]